MSTTWTEDKINKAKEYVDAGFERKDICRELKCNMATLRKYVGASYNRKYKKVTDDMTQNMKNLRAKGLSNSQIAIELGVAPSTVCKYISNQPTGNRAEYGSIVAHSTGESYIKEKLTVKNIKLKSEEITRNYSGDIFNYSINNDGIATIYSDTICGTEITLTYDNLFKFINELCDLAEDLQKITKNEKIGLDGRPLSQY